MPGKLPASRFDRRISFERQGGAKDAYGQQTAGWTAIGGCWAGYRPGSGQERREAAQEKAVLSGSFFVRQSALTAGVTEKDRLVFEGEAWDVRSNVPIGRHGREIAATRAR